MRVRLPRGTAPTALHAASALAGGVGVLLLAHVMDDATFGLFRWVVSLAGVAAVAEEWVSRGRVVREWYGQPVDGRTRSALELRHAAALLVAYVLGAAVLVVAAPAPGLRALAWAVVLFLSLGLLTQARFRTVWSEAVGDARPLYAANAVQRSLPLAQVAVLLLFGLFGLAALPALVALLLMRLPSAAAGQGPPSPPRLHGSRSLLVVAVANAVFLAADVLLVGLLLGAAAVVPVALSATLAVVVTSVLTAAAPLWLRDAVSGSDLDGLARRFLRSSTAVWSLALVGGLVAIVPVRWVFPDLPLRTDVHLAVVSWNAVRVYHVLVTGPLVHRARSYRFHATASIVLAAGNVAGNLLLIPRMGLLVAPIVSLVTLTLHHPATLLRVLPPRVRATPTAALAIAVPLAWSALVLWWLL